MSGGESTPSGAIRSVEVERKFDADAETPLPDWTRLPGVAAVGAAERRDLDAHYLDTADLVLARSGYAVRHRTGGPDEGWHVKGPIGGAGRVELGWPIGGAGPTVVPDALRAELSHLTDAPLLPLARIENLRTAYDLLDASGALIAEFVDDQVRATDQRANVVRAWREWEIELGPAAPLDHDAFFRAVEAAVHAAGGRPASSASKLARALGR